VSVFHINIHLDAILSFMPLVGVCVYVMKNNASARDLNAVIQLCFQKFWSMY